MTMAACPFCGDASWSLRAPSPLNKTERRIVRALVAGMDNTEIAETLGMTPGSVRNTLTAIYEKTNTESRRHRRGSPRVALAVRALREGWI